MTCYALVVNISQIRDQIEKELMRVARQPHCSCSAYTCCCPCTPGARWPEGRDYADGPLPPLGRDNIMEVGLAGPTIRHILETDPERWPLLRRALKAGIRKAFSTKVEWLVDKIERCNMGHSHHATKAEYNLTQIFRVQCSATALATRRYGGKDETFAVETLLDQIEHALRDGRRYLDTSHYNPCATMGGVLHLLGRWPRKEDKLQLVVLRDLIRRTSYDTDASEWIVELTLQATKGSE